MPFLGNKNKMCYNTLTIGNIAHFYNIHFCLLVNITHLYFRIQKGNNHF